MPERKHALVDLHVEDGKAVGRCRCGEWDGVADTRKKVTQLYVMTHRDVGKRPETSGPCRATLKSAFDTDHLHECSGSHLHSDDPNMHFCATCKIWFGTRA